MKCLIISSKLNIVESILATLSEYQTVYYHIDNRKEHPLCSQPLENCVWRTFSIHFKDYIYKKDSTHSTSVLLQYSFWLQNIMRCVRNKLSLCLMILALTICFWVPKPMCLAVWVFELSLHTNKFFLCERMSLYLETHICRCMCMPTLNGICEI